MSLCPGRRVGSRKKPVSRLRLHGDLSTSRVCRGIRGRIHASVIPPAQDVAFCAGGWMPPSWLGAPTPSSVAESQREQPIEIFWRWELCPTLRCRCCARPPEQAHGHTVQALQGSGGPSRPLGRLCLGCSANALPLPSDSGDWAGTHPTPSTRPPDWLLCWLRVTLTSEVLM